MSTPAYLQAVRVSTHSKALKRALERNLGLGSTVRAREATAKLTDAEQARLAVSRVLFEDGVDEA